MAASVGGRHQVRWDLASASIPYHPVARTPPDTVQTKLSYSGTYTTAAPPVSGPVSYGSTNSLTDTAAWARKYVPKTKNQGSAPADLTNQPKWKAYLGDPSKANAQVLTRMHAIRGKFGGPSDPNNMFLGTRLSNNFSPQSHYRQAELPIESFLKTKDKLGVDYTVTPHFGTLPTYMINRIQAIPNKTTQKGFAQWALEATPKTYTCDADFYRKRSSGGSEVTSSSVTLSADVGAVATPAVLGAGAGAGVLGGLAFLTGVATGGLGFAAAAGIGALAAVYSAGGYSLRGTRAKQGSYKGM